MPAIRATVPALVAALGLVSALAAPADADPAHADGETLLQCVTRCVQYEGGNSAANKAICKSRCASSTGAVKRDEPRDCMKDFKACKKGYKSGSAEYKACKQALMSCK